MIARYEIHLHKTLCEDAQEGESQQQSKLKYPVFEHNEGTCQNMQRKQQTCHGDSCKVLLFIPSLSPSENEYHRITESFKLENPLGTSSPAQ